MVMAQCALSGGDSYYRPTTELLASSELCYERHTVSEGEYSIGGKAPAAYDNELPAHTTHLKAFSIAATPVSNADYLAFMQGEGYRQRQYWNDAGWDWLQASGTLAPQHWRFGKAGWYGIGLDGAYSLASQAPAMGVNYYEAIAFARYAAARLPHEYEWETAARLQLLQQAGQVWEWCANPFHPYAGFTAFPYAGYSSPWFGDHYALRGGSLFTRAPLRRASFRNFYLPDKRHIFSGLRLAW